MSNEEHTQIFRGDDMPPEIGIAETGGPVPRRRPDAPSDQRSLHDQKDGLADTRQLHDNRDELADLRQLHDAQGAAELRKMADATDGHADTRQIHDARGGIDTQHARDGDGPVDRHDAHDAQGPSDLHNLSDAQGLVDAILAQDAEGPSNARSITDAEGPADTRHVQDAEGPSLQRQMQDSVATPAAAPERQAYSFHDDEEPEPDADMVTLNSAGEIVEPEATEAAVVAAVEAPVPDADLTFKVEEAATPWALSIHLEARIASLTESTAKVNEQLGGLEDSIKRLAKRIGK